MAAADGNLLPRDSQPGSNYGDAPDTLVDWILRETQYLYSLVLLVAFIGCVSWYSVYNAKKEEDVVQSKARGPGGKPLPITKKKKRDDGERKLGPHFGRSAKNIFRYLAAVVFLSYLATGISMFIHAFWYEDPFKWSKEGLAWAGEWSMVSVLDIFNRLRMRTRISLPASLYPFCDLACTPTLTLTRFMPLARPFSTYTSYFPSSIGVKGPMSSIFLFGSLRFWAK